MEPVGSEASMRPRSSSFSRMLSIRSTMPRPLIPSSLEMSNPAWGVQPYPNFGAVVTPVREVAVAEEAPAAEAEEAPPAAEEEAAGEEEAAEAAGPEVAARPEAGAAEEADGSSWSSSSTAPCTSAAG